MLARRSDSSSDVAVHVPDEVTDGEAAFVTVGAIALHGVRLVRPELGQVVVVIGLGLIGQIAVQLLASHGFQVVRVPALVLAGAGSFVTYTNALFDRRPDGKRVVYLPTYALPALDDPENFTTAVDLMIEAIRARAAAAHDPGQPA